MKILAACSALMLLVPGALFAAPKPPPPPPKEPDFGSSVKVEIKKGPEKPAVFSVSIFPDLSFTGTSQCPSIGSPDFTYDIATTFIDPNDDITFYDRDNKPVLEITHNRVLNTAEHSGNKVIERQDWTRIKENRNGIDDTTGIRHYLGNYTVETMVPNGTLDADGTETARGHGIMTLREPLFLSPSDPEYFYATRVDAVQYIGPQSAWLEPFSQFDARQCAFLNDGVPRAAATTGCVVTENVVGCPKP